MRQHPPATTAHIGAGTPQWVCPKDWSPRRVAPVSLWHLPIRISALVNGLTVICRFGSARFAPRTMNWDAGWRQKRTLNSGLKISATTIEMMKNVSTHQFAPVIHDSTPG